MQNSSVTEPFGSENTKSVVLFHKTAQNKTNFVPTKQLIYIRNKESFFFSYLKELSFIVLSSWAEVFCPLFRETFVFFVIVFFLWFEGFFLYLLEDAEKSFFNPNKPSSLLRYFFILKLILPLLSCICPNRFKTKLKQFICSTFFSFLIVFFNF